MIELDIIIPIYNEGNNIKVLLDEFKQKLKMNYKVLICYDHENESGLKFISKKNEKIIFVKNLGSGPNEAIKSGFKKSSSDIIVVYMSDDFENIELLNEMFKLINNNHELIIPSRYIKNGKFLNAKFHKKFITNCGSFLMYNICGIPYKDCTNAFKMFKKKIFEKIDITSKIGFTFAIELTVKAHLNKFKIKEIPCIWKDLPNRKSNFKIFRWLPYYTYWVFYAFFHRIYNINNKILINNKK